MHKIDARRVELNLEDTSRLGQLVIVRAHKLMAYGVSASYSNDADYNLPGFIRYEDDLEPLEDDFRLSFQEMFRSWTVGNGLRDMLEGTAITLDGIYATLQQVRGIKESRTEKAIEKQIKPFTKRGVTEKLSDLKRDFKIEIDTADHITTIVKARNSLTHRFGMVGENDCDDGKTHLTISWRSLDMSVIRTDGTEVPVTWDTVHPVPGIKGDQVRYGMKAETLRFGLGEEIVIPPRMLEEISVMMRFSVGKLHQLALNWLIDNGVPVHGGAKVEGPTVSLEVTVSEPKNNKGKT